MYSVGYTAIATCAMIWGPLQDRTSLPRTAALIIYLCALQNVFNHSYSVCIQVYVFIYSLANLKFLIKYAQRTVKPYGTTLCPVGTTQKTTESIVLMEKEAAQAIYTLYVVL